QSARFNELLTNSLVDAGVESIDDDQPVGLLNPLSQELGMLRTDMFTSLLEAARYNSNRKQDDLRLFEFDKTYRKSAKGFTESRRLALIMVGDRTQRSWNADSRPVDIYFMKGFVKQVLHRCGCDVQSLQHEACSSEVFAAALTVSTGKHRLVRFGQLRKSLLRKFDLPAQTVFADFDWEAITQAATTRRLKVTDIPKFPQVSRDLSMVIDGHVQFGQIESLAYKTEKKLLKDVQLFDVYEGEKVGEGKKSYAM
ncbi:MAG: phenylalanine--tRNA ligase subunit beta, partial [Flavobacteriales bacterium]